MVSQPDLTKKASRLRLGIARTLALGGGIVALVSGAGWLGAWAWPLDLCSHFRVQYTLVLGGIAVVLLLLRLRPLRVMTGLIVVMALANLATILPRYVGRSDAPATGNPPLRAMLLNVNTDYGNPDKVRTLIGSMQPDILVLEELNRQWVTELTPLRKDYHYAHMEPREDNFGIVLLSKYPFRNAQTIYLGSAGVPTIMAEVVTPQGVCTILATHPLPPAGRLYAHLRNEQLAALAQYCQQITGPLLVLGDLNVTPWSPFFLRLLQDSGLYDSAHGFGVQATWPVDNILLRIPIDHCLHSPDIQVVDRSVGPDVGSDHFPLGVEFNLPSHAAK